MVYDKNKLDSIIKKIENPFYELEEKYNIKIINKKNNTIVYLYNSYIYERGINKLENFVVNKNDMIDESYIRFINNTIFYDCEVLASEIHIINKIKYIKILILINI